MWGWKSWHASGKSSPAGCKPQLLNAEFGADQNIRGSAPVCVQCTDIRETDRPNVETRWGGTTKPNAPDSGNGISMVTSHVGYWRHCSGGTGARCRWAGIERSCLSVQCFGISVTFHETDTVISAKLRRKSTFIHFLWTYQTKWILS